MRAVGVLGPGSLRWLLPLGFVLMALLPFALLDSAGRRDMGLKLPAQPRIYLVAVLAGAAAALVCFALGYGLYGPGADNWFVSIASSYRRTMDTTGWSVMRLHLVFTVPAVIFSPIGEEIFFRGYLQQALEQRFSPRVATLAECAAFGAVHLCHHGLLLTAAGVSIRPVSGVIWMALMFCTALVFARLRSASGSLLPAMLAHALFNLCMNATIFIFLWR
ncbi:MAG: CPBP family intramembrane glutamic endopeptidase [Pseudomonadota bacterium]